MQALLEHILAKPDMYCGKRFETIDEFSLFFAGLSVGLLANGAASIEDQRVLGHFGAFMRHHRHGENKNCHWEYDLLAREGSHRAAVASAVAFMRFLRSQIGADGDDKIDDLLGRANRIHAHRLPDGQMGISDQSRANDEEE
jgi:hypothetical protein